jgi:hypothetical protein
VAGFDAEEDDDVDPLGFPGDISPAKPCPLQRAYPRPTASTNATSINTYFQVPPR